MLIFRAIVAAFVRCDARLSGRSTEVRAARWSDCVAERRATSCSVIRQSCLLSRPRAGRAHRRVRSIASDLLRHQIWPLAFCRGRHELYIGASHSSQFDCRPPGHFIKPRCTTRQRETIRLTGDNRRLSPSLPSPVSLSLSQFAYLLTYGRFGDRQAV